MTSVDEQDIDVTVILEGPKTVTVTTAPPTTAVVGAPTAVKTISTSTEKVSVEELGIVGPPGPQGPPGTGAPEVYQLQAVSTWNHAHDFPYLPDVRLVDENNEVVEIGVEYPDAQTVYLTFPQPFTGTVYLS